MKIIRDLLCAVLLLSGCGGGSELGEACEEVAMAGCLRSLTCNLTFTDERLCADNAVYACCEEDGTCGEALDASQADRWSTCAADLETQPCDEVQEAPPPSCVGLPLAP
ncbi:MAG: hypothetical protein EA397_04145 [Deltaproteobacteria bacterium]|nr:MAG: hypothetical protein EA397_04145 [Deltaproteobacteria bacterium]